MRRRTTVRRTRSFSKSYRLLLSGQNSARRMTFKASPCIADGSLQSGNNIHPTSLTSCQMRIEQIRRMPLSLRNRETQRHLSEDSKNPCLRHMLPGHQSSRSYDSAWRLRRIAEFLELRGQVGPHCTTRMHYWFRCRCTDRFHDVSDGKVRITYVPVLHQYWILGRGGLISVFDPNGPTDITHVLSDIRRHPNGQALKFSMLCAPANNDIVLGATCDRKIILWNYSPSRACRQVLRDSFDFERCLL